MIKIPISVVILTKNEEANIEECINSLDKFDEIFTLDSDSTDHTRVIAENLGAIVVDFKWNGQYPKKKQWALKNLPFSNSWILLLDADERVSIQLANELRDFIESRPIDVSAGIFKVDYFFSNQKLRFGQKVSKISLCKIHEVYFPEISDLNAPGSWEVEGHYQPTAKGKIHKFRNRLIHNDNDDLFSWTSRHVNYAKWEVFISKNGNLAHEINSHKTLAGKLFVSFGKSPLLFFLYSYFFKFGFADGRAGFNFAFAKTWYYWLQIEAEREEKSRNR